MLNNIPLYKRNYKFLATHKQYDQGRGESVNWGGGGVYSYIRVIPD